MTKVTLTLVYMLMAATFFEGGAISRYSAASARKMVAEKRKKDEKVQVSDTKKEEKVQAATSDSRNHLTGEELENMKARIERDMKRFKDIEDSIENHNKVTALQTKEKQLLQQKQKTLLEVETKRQQLKANEERRKKEEQQQEAKDTEENLRKNLGEAEAAEAVLLAAHSHSSCNPQSPSTADAGYSDNYRGWYDTQGCGCCNEYCRWVGGSGSGGDPATRQTYGGSWWSCRTHSHHHYTMHNHFGSWNFAKCSYQGECAPSNAAPFSQGTISADLSFGGAPEITVTGNGCVKEGNCVKSRNYPGHYYNYDTCSISFVPGIELQVENFNVENYFDRLTVNGHSYSGWGVTYSPQNLVATSTPATWYSDYSVTAPGWKICQDLSAPNANQAEALPEDSQILVSGSGCVVSGNCVTSRSYPNNYGNRESCSITWMPWRALTVTSFNTEHYFDKLIVDGTTYTGTSGPEGKVPLLTTTWSSDFTVVRPGWKICQDTPVQKPRHSDVPLMMISPHARMDNSPEYGRGNYHYNKGEADSNVQVGMKVKDNFDAWGAWKKYSLAEMQTGYFPWCLVQSAQEAAELYKLAETADSDTSFKGTPVPVLTGDGKQRVTATNNAISTLSGGAPLYMAVGSSAVDHDTFCSERIGIAVTGAAADSPEHFAPGMNQMWLTFAADRTRLLTWAVIGAGADSMPKVSYVAADAVPSVVFETTMTFLFDEFSAEDNPLFFHVTVNDLGLPTLHMRIEHWQDHQTYGYYSIFFTPRDTMPEYDQFMNGWEAGYVNLPALGTTFSPLGYKMERLIQKGLQIWSICRCYHDDASDLVYCLTSNNIVQDEFWNSVFTYMVDLFVEEAWRSGMIDNAQMAWGPDGIPQALENPRFGPGWKFCWEDPHGNYGDRQMHEVGQISADIGYSPGYSGPEFQAGAGAGGFDGGYDDGSIGADMGFGISPLTPVTGPMPPASGGTDFAYGTGPDGGGIQYGYPGPTGTMLQLREAQSILAQRIQRHNASAPVKMLNDDATGK